MKPPSPLARAACTALVATSPVALAQTAPPAPPPAPAQQVEITGGRGSDTEQRRQSTASKIVIGRDEIDKFGDSTLGEVLRRLPGVTTPGAPGRGGPPRLRGLGGGYTQILIDGQRMPPGFSLETVPPDQVERIEILRAPTAETGARAIAGTINIVLREGYRRRVNDLRIGAAVENGAWTPGLNWTRNDGADDFTYNLSGGVFFNRRRSSGATETVDTDRASGTVTQQVLETSETTEQRRGVHLGARLQWRLGEGGDSFSLNPNLFHNESHSDRALASTPALQYAFGETVGDGRFSTGRLNATWRQRLGSALRMELNATGGGSRSFNQSLRRETAARGALRTVDETSTTRERTATASAKFTQLVGGDESRPGSEHSLVGGFEAESVHRREQRITADSAAPVPAGFNDALQATSLRLAAYGQDEWNLTPSWGLHAGLRWESITTRGAAEGGVRPENRSSVTTPLVHVLWKPDPKGRDQVRVSLTRSYRAPPLENLIARPRLSSKFPAGATNDPTSPDRVGNPDLKPELASGIDIAIERYLAGGGLVSANVFRRDIRDLMRSVTALESVPWSPVPRWVARQRNVGRAVTQGLELETKFALDQLVAEAPRVELRANLALYRSRVDSVPGPDNRLAEQAKATGNLGADYRFRGWPLTLGGNLNWVPAYETQLTEEQRTKTGTKRVFDAYALWTFSPTVGLRLLASNLAAQDYESSNTITTDNRVETARSFGPSYTNWQLRLELKL